MSILRPTLVGISLASLACGGTPAGGGTPSASDTTTEAPGSTGDLVVDLGEPLRLDLPALETDVGAPDACTCAPATDRVIVVTDDGELATFDPESLSFETVVPALAALPGCGDSLYSMALDRAGRAWLQFTDGSIGRLSLADPAGCELVEIESDAGPLGNFGMGFLPTADDSCELLFGHRNPIADDEPGQLLVIDPVMRVASDVGQSAYHTAELSGTGDGRLFAMAVDAAAGTVELAQLDPTSAAVIEADTLVTGFVAGGGFAFATWGGDIWLFTQSGESPGRSEVNVLDHDDSDGNGVRDLTEVVGTVPLGSTIVGAGVSTCAPPGPVG